MYSLPLDLSSRGLLGLQTQSNTHPTYSGPLDAIKKISAAHGIKGIYKGQNVTFVREAAGYGVYFWAYEKLVQREMAKKGIRREEIGASSAVLYGAAAGYVVMCIQLLHPTVETDSEIALGSHIPHRHDQVPNANRRLHTFHRTEVPVNFGLRANRVEDGGYQRLHQGTGSHVD